MSKLGLRLARALHPASTNLRLSRSTYQQVVFEGIVGPGHQSDIAIDEVKIDKCGDGGGDGGKSFHFISVA